MIDQLAEGIESLRLPCSWILLFAGIALSIYARRRSAVVLGAFVSSVIMIAWLRFSGWWFAAPSGVLEVLIGLGLIATIVFAWRRNSTWTDVLLGASVGTAAVWSWIPCVGPELGHILNNATSAPLSHLAGTIAFVGGLLLPFVLIAAMDIAVPPLQQLLDKTWIAGLGAVLLLAFAVLFAGTWSDDLTSMLLQNSSF